MNAQNPQTSKLRLFLGWFFFFPLFLHDQFKDKNIVSGVILTFISPSLWVLFCAGLGSFSVYQEKQDEKQKAEVSERCWEGEEAYKYNGQYECTPIEDLRITTNRAGLADIEFVSTQVSESFEQELNLQLSLENILIKANETYVLSSEEGPGPFELSATTVLFNLPADLQIKTEVKNTKTNDEFFYFTEVYSNDLPLRKDLLKRTKELFRYTNKNKIKQIGLSGKQIKLATLTHSKTDGLSSYFYKKDNLKTSTISLKEGLYFFEKTQQEGGGPLTGEYIFTNYTITILDMRNKLGLCFSLYKYGELDI